MGVILSSGRLTLPIIKVGGRAVCRVILVFRHLVAERDDDHLEDRDTENNTQQQPTLGRLLFPNLCAKCFTVFQLIIYPSPLKTRDYFHCPSLGNKCVISLYLSLLPLVLNI